MNTIPYTLYDKTYQLQIIIDEYRNSWTCIEFIDMTDPKEPDSFQVATVWLDILMPDFAYLDVNNFPGIEELFKQYNLWEPAHRTRLSGFVEYPLYRLNMDEINKYLYHFED